MPFWGPTTFACKRRRGEIAIKTPALMPLEGTGKWGLWALLDTPCHTWRGKDTASEVGKRGSLPGLTSSELDYLRQSHCTSVSTSIKWASCQATPKNSNKN